MQQYYYRIRASQYVVMDAVLVGEIPRSREYKGDFLYWWNNIYKMVTSIRMGEEDSLAGVLYFRFYLGIKIQLEMEVQRFLRAGDELLKQETWPGFPEANRRAVETAGDALGLSIEDLPSRLQNAAPQ